MIKSNRRGSVLVHVLITGVIVAFIAAGMMRMVLMNYIAVDRAAKGVQNRKEAEAMLQRALTYWNKNGSCTSIPGSPAINCAGSACTCTCTGTAAAGSATTPTIVVSGPAGGPCAVTVTSSDPL